MKPHALLLFYLSQYEPAIFAPDAGCGKGSDATVASALSSLAASDGVRRWTCRTAASGLERRFDSLGPNPDICLRGPLLDPILAGSLPTYRRERQVRRTALVMVLLRRPRPTAASDRATEIRITHREEVDSPRPRSRPTMPATNGTGPLTPWNSGMATPRGPFNRIKYSLGGKTSDHDRREGSFITTGRILAALRP